MSRSFRPQCALVTGASSGIGLAFVRRLVADGVDVVMVARSRELMESEAAALCRISPRSRIHVCACDLTEPGAAAELYQDVRDAGFPVDLLINNAGVGSWGAFAEQDLSRLQSEIVLNCQVVVEMTRLYLPDLLARADAAIINVASLAAFQPTPGMAVYGATKAFVRSFTEALAVEVKGRGVRCMALCPGPVDTAFFEATGHPDLIRAVPEASLLQPDQVVEEVLQALEQRRLTFVPGALMQWVGRASSLAPRRLSSRVAAYLLSGRGRLG